MGPKVKQASSQKEHDIPEVIQKPEWRFLRAVKEPLARSSAMHLNEDMEKFWLCALRIFRVQHLGDTEKMAACTRMGFFGALMSGNPDRDIVDCSLPCMTPTLTRCFGLPCLLRKP